MGDALVRRVVEAFDWHRALGNEVVEAPHARFVMDRAHPDVWSANHVGGVSATEPREIGALLA